MNLKFRKPILVFSFLAAMAVSRAQDFPTYGKVTAEEINLKECAFDKEATAVVLLDEAVSTYSEEHNLITYRHVRIKILKEKGLGYADIAIPFYRTDDFEYISNVEGMVINTDNGNPVIQALDKKSIFKKNISERYGEVRFTFPSIKAGSIVEYRFQSTMKHYGGLEDWFFQRDIPVVLSKYMLYIVPGYEFTYQVRKSSNHEIKVVPEAKEGRVFFEMRNIPGLDDEPYMDARRDYTQRVMFQLSGYGSGSSNKRKYMTSWDELTRELLKSPDLGLQIGKDIPGTDDFVKLVKMNSSPNEKMRLILNYVRKNMTWNGYNSKYSIDGVKSAWNKKKGTSGDLNLILTNLLRAAGLEAYPMLVSERYNGKISTEYPFVDQFNTIYAAVLADGKRYYLDATDPLTPPHIIPYNILNTTAFILNKKAGGLVNIADESLQYHDLISIMAEITPDENIKGEAFLNSIDYARIRRLERYSSNTSKYMEENFKRRSSMNIDSFAIINEDNDSLALQHKFKFAAPLEGTGDYKFIPLNLFSGFESNPFISDKRFSDINFSFKRTVSVNTVISLPEGYIIDAVPKSIQIINPDKSVVFSRELFTDPTDKKIVSRIKMDFKKSHYTVDEYEGIKEFYKKMFDMLNEQIVIKKKG